MSDTLNRELSETVQDRLQALQELTEFTENCETKLKELFDSLGWDHEWSENIDTEAMETCPYDPNHRVPCSSMQKHKIKCLLNQMDYSKEEQAEMYDSSTFYVRANIPSVVMDKSSQHQVILQARAKAPLIRMEGQYSQGDYSKDGTDVPQNHKRAICDLTVADRLALYDHVIQETESQHRATSEAGNNEDLYVDLVAKLNKDDGQSGPKSHLEVLAEMRDYKRRRQSYRAKNVHITKKSYTEVIREVIDVHSGELAKMWQEEEREMEEASKHSSHRRQSKDQRSSSVESMGLHQSPISSREGRSSRDGHSRSSRHKRKRSRDHSRERCQNEDDDSKEKRESRSPEERHHHKKKKKKKKMKKE